MNSEIRDLQKKITQFRDERNWKQFHKIKDLMLALNIEVSELQELFLWKSEEEISNIPKEKIEEEIADIYIYLAYICVEYGIDLEDAVSKKIQLNGQKYPVEQSRGSIKKYNEL